ncbi:DUF11 domain-containing protein [bacterium]|nr:DUF11 domain-containing protein [bacterium]
METIANRGLDATRTQGIIRRSRSLAIRLAAGAAVALCLLSPLGAGRAAAQTCAGDCDYQGGVTINDLVLMVNLALGGGDVAQCRPGDQNGDGAISVNEIVAAVNFALGGRLALPIAGTCERPGLSGLAECAPGTVVRLIRCNDARCRTSEPIASAQVDASGAFRFDVAADCAQASARYLLAARIDGEDQRFGDVGPAGAAAPAAVVISPSSEAAVRLVEERGIDNFGAVSFRDLLDVVEEANPPASFAGQTVAAAAEQAQRKALESPDVNNVLLAVLRHDRPAMTSIEPRGDLDVYTLELHEPTTVILQATRSTGGLVPCLEVRSLATGPVPGGQACGDPSARLDLNLVPGAYAVLVNDQSNTQIGSYDLYYARLRPEDVDGIPVESQSLDIGDLDPYGFSVTRSSTLILKATRQSGAIAPCVELWRFGALASTRLDTICDPGTARLDRGADPGFYFAIVSDQTTQGAGSYKLTLDQLPAGGGPTPTFTPTSLPGSTSTATPSPSLTGTPTVTPSATVTYSSTSTPFATTSSTPTATRTVSASPTVTLSPTPIPRLILALQAAPDPIRPGGLLTVRLTVTNQGNRAVTNVQVNSPVPGNTQSVNASDGGNCFNGCIAGRIATWDIGTLAMGASRTVELTAFVVSGATNGTVIQSSATVTGDAAVGGAAQASVEVQGTPQLAVALQAERDPAEAGRALTYNVTFSNPGTSDANDAVLTARLPVGTSFQSASDGGVSGENRTVTWSLGKVAVGASGRRQFTVQVGQGETNGSVLLSDAELRDAALGASARATSAVTIRTGSPIALTLVASPNSVPRGGQLTYRLTATNRSGSAQNVTLRSVVPGSVSNVNTSDGGSCFNGCIEGRIINWDLGSLPAGGSRTAEVTLYISDDAARFPNGTLLSHRAWVIGAGGAVAEETVVIDSSPQLALAMRAERDPIGAGQNLTYTVTFGNPGTMDASNAVLTARVPVGATFDSASDGGTESAGVVTWAVGPIGAGKSGRRQFTVAVASEATNGTILESDAELRDSGLGASARAHGAATVRTDSPITLTLTASADPDPVRRGEVLTYLATVENSGSLPQTITLRSAVPDRVSGVSAGNGGSCFNGCIEGRIINWSLGSVPAGANRTVLVTMFVSGDAARFPGGSLLTNRVWAFSDAGSATAEQTTRICNGVPSSCTP